MNVQGDILFRLRLLALFLLAAVPQVQAAFEGAIEVAQPLSTFEGIRISRVTYMAYRDGPAPGRNVPFVVAESRVMDAQGHFVNRNAASVLEFKSWADPRHENGRLIGDTLRVYLDVSSSKPVPEHSSWDRFDAAQATVECILTTVAANRRGLDVSGHVVDAKYVDIQVLGEAGYVKLGGVFPFASLGQLPRRRDFP